MASLLTHAALPLLVGRAIDLPAGVPRRRLALAAVACACVPDLDVIAFAFDIQKTELFGHRGLTHSLIFAAALAALLNALLFRKPRAFVLLFLAGASHGVLDMLTRGDVGVALLAPYGARLLFPLHPLPVCPLGVTEYLGPWGLRVVAAELLYVAAPVGLVSELMRRRRAGLTFKPLSLATAAWLILAAGVFLRFPWLLTAQPRELQGYGAHGSEDDLGWIPVDALPEQRLLTRFDELQPWFGKTLAAEPPPWSGSFFPAWYGGESGRWRDGRLTLIGRTLFGTAPPLPDDAKAWLGRNHGDGLSPTEKYDLAHADYTFAATKVSLDANHNVKPLPRYWDGMCNGVAAAGIERPEPYRAVDVTSPDGHVVRFHPIDVKALLAESFYWQHQVSSLGGDNCNVVSFDSGRRCSMNPGGLVIATLNHLGRARRSFLLDVHPTPQAQFYAVASARIDVVRGPYPLGTNDGAGVSLVDVDLHFVLSSTLLPVESGDVPEGDHYARVGLHPVPFHWQAALLLGPEHEILGGRWTGDPPDGPDKATFSSGPPLLDGGMLQIQPKLEWAFIDALATASAAQGPGAATLVLDGGTP